MLHTTFSRRAFLASAAGAPLLRAAPFTKPIGINLYTVRDSLSKDPEGTYKALAEMGIQQIEVRANHLREHGHLIRAAGLDPVHMFIDSPIVTGEWDAALAMQRAMARRMNRPEPTGDDPHPTLTEMAELANDFGIRRLGISYLQAVERPGGILRMNQAVEELQSHGLGFYYHNHAWEFDSSDGPHFIERLLAQGHPKLTIELDVFWATVGGEDVTGLLGKWKGRVASLHVKDVAADAPRQKTESNMPAGAFKEVGAGILDWPRLLRAAADADAGFYLIEQDMTPGNPLDSVRQSVEFLKSVQV